MDTHRFTGQWITNETFAEKPPRNVFHRQLEPFKLPCENQDSHILFRKKFLLPDRPQRTVLFLSADDHYRLYLNGRFVAEGPTASYPWAYNYNTVDVSAYLQPGENTIAVHTLYYGRVNRVCVRRRFSHRAAPGLSPGRDHRIRHAVC